MSARLSWWLLTRPRRAIPAIQGDVPSGWALAGFLGAVGLLRGLLEAVWLYAMARRPGLLEQLLLDPARYLAEGALFVAANGMTAYLRWAMYAFLFMAVSRWFGRKVPFARLGTLTALLLGLYVVPVLVNTLYLFVSLPVLQFPVSQAYQPFIGLGTLVATFWFAWVAFWIFCEACGLSKVESLLGAVFIPLLDKVLFIGGAAVVFQWRWLTWLPVSARMGLVTLGFLAAAAAAIPLFLWLGRRLSRVEVGR